MNQKYTKSDAKSQINNDGYVLLRNVLTNDDLDYGLSCMQNENKVNYSIMKQFIDTRFFPVIQGNVGFITEPNYVKFRFSNNNNSTDASTFHGDIYNHTNTEFLPIYTCLCYFDDAQLEVIPGSHKYNNNGWSIDSFNKRTVLNVQRGDILVFHANMHHRGVNYNKVSDRRLLQVFEVFPDKKTYNEQLPKLVIVESSKSLLFQNILNPVMYCLSKIPSAIDCVTFFHYILMYNDLHYKMVYMDITPWDKTDKYVSYEPGKRVLMEDLVNNNQVEDLNVNILCDKNVYSRSYSNFYLYIYILYWIVSLAILYAIKQYLSTGNNYKKLKSYFNFTRKLKR